MSKILSLFSAIIILIFSVNLVSASDYLKIISREQWGADEQYRYWNSTYWTDIFAKRAANSAAWKKKWANYSQSRKDSITAANNKKADKNKLMNNYLSNNFSNNIETVSYQRFDGENKLSWAISKTDSVKNIVIHHTAAEYKDSYSGIKDIYRYHSLNNQWGDIGYNYVIGYNGEIFEGRAGGDYVVGAHDTWNNYSTVGIAIMGDYDTRKLNSQQYSSLKKLTSHLTKKYGIDLNKKIPYHKECFGNKCHNGLETNYYFPIVGHKDGKLTSCPGDNLYHTIVPKLIKELQPETSGYKNVSYTETLEKQDLLQKKLSQLDWDKIRQKYNSLSIKQKIILHSRIKYLIGYEIGWKKKILYDKFLDEVKRT